MSGAGCWATALDASKLFPDNDATVPLPLETGPGGNCDENQNEDSEGAGEERYGGLWSGCGGGGVSCGDAYAPSARALYLRVGSREILHQGKSAITPRQKVLSTLERHVSS